MLEIKAALCNMKHRDICDISTPANIQKLYILIAAHKVFDEFIGDSHFAFLSNYRQLTHA